MDPLDVACRTVDSPVGPLLLAATEAGLVRVAFTARDHAELADVMGARLVCAPRRLDSAARQLDEYFARTRTAFDLPLDLRSVVGFRRAVIEQLAGIGYGRTASYAEVAASAGSARAVRAVGTACAQNPVPVVVPCHRVVRSDGSWGRYAGGTEAKAALLTLEGVVR